MSHSPAQLYTQPTFLELFTPKLITVFREGYGWRDLRADAVSGLTVAVVALPLSMAIAIAIHAVSLTAASRRHRGELPKLFHIRGALRTLHISDGRHGNYVGRVASLIVRHVRPNWLSLANVVSVAGLYC